jgi:FkbM family methyltransferase
VVSKRLITPGVSVFDQNPVLIYGAGKIGHDLARLLMSRGIDVRGFLDRNPKAEVAGLPVYQATAGQELIRQLGENVEVVIGLFNHYVSVKPIQELLKKQGFKAIHPFHKVYWKFSQELGSLYYLSPDSSLFSDGRVESVRRLLNDDESRRLYDEHLELRQSGDLNLLSVPDIENQYTPRDLFFPDRPLKLMDCGAYTGDTLQKFIEHGFEVERAVLLEADIKNFEQMTNNLADCSGFVRFVHGASWSSSGTLSIGGGAGLASKISEGGGTLIPAYSVDDLCREESINFLKMDVEGAEMDSLKGSRETIRRDRPFLALSAYHCPYDMMTIPLFIEELDLGYSIHFRSHGYNGFDLVCYGIPQKVRGQ